MRKICFLFFSLPLTLFAQSFEKCVLISAIEKKEGYIEVSKQDGYVITSYSSTPIFGLGGSTVGMKSSSDTYVLFKDSINQKRPQKLSASNYLKVIVYDKQFDRLYVKHPSAFGKMYKFLPKLVDGKVSLYRHDYFINGMYKKKRFYLVRDTVTTDVNTSGFSREMADFFKENADLSNKIRSRKLTIKNIEEIVETFNQGYLK